MTISIDQLGAESVLVVRVDWGGGPMYLYADKDIVVPLGACQGKIIQANVVSKTGQIGQSGVSKTASVTLDDTDGLLKATYDITRMEGSPCSIYQFINQGTPKQQLLMSGVVSSDIKWIEGERVLSFSVEGGTNRTGQSIELGYAPEEGAFAGLNANAVGINWPIVFGTAAKVPAVRIEYYDDITLYDTVDYLDATYTFNNGSQLPQSPTVIQIELDQVLFEGTMTGDVFTPTSKNMPRYVSQAFAARDGADPDALNPCVAWVPTGVNISGMFVYINHPTYGDFVNQCNAQIGTKCIFALGWFNYKCIDATYSITEAAKYCRNTWPIMFEMYSDGGNLMNSSSPDGWSIYKDTPVKYDSGGDYMDRYVVNLYPSTSILAVWGKRQWNGKVKWEKIPSSYYHKHLSQVIVTNPGAVTRNVTVLDFPLPLKDYQCENWQSDIYVTVDSTLEDNPKDIVHWVTDNFTTFTYDATSDDPPVTMNFAYFETTDAIEFLRGIAYQSASVIQINGTTLRLTFLAQAPGISPNVEHTFTDDLIIMKSLELGFKAIEEINTIHKSTYVTDYSGEATSKKIYAINQNITEFGVKTQEDNMWALTCENPVKAVTDFWGVKKGNSWKTVKMDCFLNLSDAEVFDGAKFQIDPFIGTDIRGLLTSVIHDTDRPIVTIEVELSVKAGTDVEDPDYWSFGLAMCVAPTDTEQDFVPAPDPKCATFSIDIGIKTPRTLFRPVITRWPVRIVRGSAFSLEVKIIDEDDVFQAINAEADGKIYTSNNMDCFIIKDGVLFVAGVVILTGLIIKKSLFIGQVHLNLVFKLDKQISSGDVYTWRPRHI